MINRKAARVGFLALALIIITSLIVPAYAQDPTATPAPAPAGGPTATPDTPDWLAFDAARTALEDELQQEITFVRSWEYDGDAQWEKGITSCRTLEEGETEQAIFFGWRFVITLLNGQQYEVRVTYNREVIVICDEVTVAAAVPTTAANPNLPGAVAGTAGRGALEVGAQLQVGNTPAATYQRMKNEAGMTWVKKQVVIGVNDTAVPVYLAEAQANGMKLLVSVIGDKNAITTPAFQDSVAAKMAEFARLGVHAIEVWNEANIDREWPKGQIGGASYVQFLAKAFNAIKAANPNTLVVSAGPAPTGAAGAQTACSQNQSICNDDVWYREVAAAGGARYMDCVGVHYNEGTTSPTQSSGAAQGDNFPTRYYGTNLNRALAPFPGKQACITEIGYLTSAGYGPLPGNFTWAAGTDINEHAQWLGQAVDVAQAAGNVRLLIVFNFNLTVYTDDPQGGYAMVRPDGTCPACATIKAAISS